MSQRMYLTQKKICKHVYIVKRTKKIIWKIFTFFFVPNGTKSHKIAQNGIFLMSPWVCLENVYGDTNFFPFLLMYVNDFPMILWCLDTLHAVCIEIHKDKIRILTDSFCTVNPYVWKFETQKTLPLFGKRGRVFVVVPDNRYGSHLGLKM